MEIIPDLGVLSVYIIDYLYLTVILLRIHVTSPILGEYISAIVLPQQRKQWLSVGKNSLLFLK